MILLSCGLLDARHGITEARGAWTGRARTHRYRDGSLTVYYSRLAICYPVLTAHYVTATTYRKQSGAYWPELLN
jgi:hypothetical protein